MNSPAPPDVALETGGESLQGPSVTPRSAKWFAALLAFSIVYFLVYPLVPIALKQSGVGQRLPDWAETGFKISAGPLILAHKTLPAYRSYVEFLAHVVSMD